MKKLATRLILLIGIFCLVCCYTGDGDNDKTYYQFDDSDKAFLINYEYQVNQIITYENQDAERIHFKVILNETKKQGYSAPGTFWGTTGGGLSHYYDTVIIRFEILENQNYGRPEGLVNYIFSINFGTLKNGINFPMWNVSNFTYIEEIQNPANIIMTRFNDQPKTQMNIGNHLFKKVVIIESGSNDEYLNSLYGTITKNVNKVYYDYDFGVIRFDDINGKEWKVIYPE